MNRPSMRPLASLLLIAIFAAPSVRSNEGGAPTMLRLRSGAIQWGEVLEHTSEGVVFQRLDTGGVVRLSWKFLDPSQERSLRTQFGYIDTSSEILFIDADRLVLVDGKEITGLIVGRGDGTIRVKTESGLIDVPAVRVRAVSGGVRVPALEQVRIGQVLQLSLLLDLLDSPRNEPRHLVGAEARVLLCRSLVGLQGGGEGEDLLAKAPELEEPGGVRGR